ncbi:aminotransferase class V-fold PLP-dependent enzyme [Paenibacillus sp. GSMTC-2017]|uniref:aminotransferase class V-fold PLP-dependent enzyme n=1 Tax=Paenibacillus sp. GSMTC-2017 TaxID=2794350 RepID=UPI0018D816AB|nr:aminotransferase class V-fold PLP-dependent enzyme [Paenibacillus sp. GSMTC-2017]MBH5319309.1 aminotransferase class V-fold PLP-dependent enzyme [Paenibacillus sp. GSMTC-2017]
MNTEEQGLIYLDHAATSWPKPKAVTDAVVNAIINDGANPGRGSHAMAVRASRILFDTRKQLAKLFNIKNPNDIAFTSNTTMSLNMAIKGWLKPGDHVISTTVEHNSVRRPLHYLEQTIGIEVSYIETDQQGKIRVDEIEEAIQGRTTLIIVNHSSNLLGTILPVAEIGELAKKHGVKLLVDAAQSAGIIPVDVQAMGIHMLAFPGHKGLLGPQGTGGLYIAPEIDLEPLLHGGTGSQSETPHQPLVRPDRYEAGTQNTAGLAGLQAGVKYVLEESVEKIHAKEWGLAQRLMEGLSKHENVQILGPALGEPRTGIVAFNVDGVDPSELSFILDQHYKIAVRAGFHCTPLAHVSAGTVATGAVRASVGVFTTEEEVDALLIAIKEISQQYSL